jgi:hypothetical protein
MTASETEFLVYRMIHYTKERLIARLGRNYERAFSRAAREGNMRIMELLIQNDDIQRGIDGILFIQALALINDDIPSLDESYDESLVEAALHGHEKVVQMLLQYRDTPKRMDSMCQAQYLAGRI